MRRTGIAILVVTLFGTSACASVPVPTTTDLPSRAPSPASSPVVSARPSVSDTRVPMSEIAARAAHTATPLPDGRILIAGGCVVDGCSTATDETFLVPSDGAAGLAGPFMSHARDSHSATVFGGRVYFAGGFPGEGGGTRASIDVYDPANGSMSEFASLGTARGGHAAAVLGNAGILVVGGWIGSRTYTAAAELIDPTRGVVALPDAPWAADALDAVTLADGRVLVTGGQVRPGEATNQAALFDPSTMEWNLLAPMGTPRLKHTSVLLDDGRVLIIGGTPDDDTLLSTTELFDPATGTFTTGPRLAEPRYKMPGGAVALPGQRVLIAGGGRSVELLDVRAGQSQVVHEFDSRGSFTTVAPLGDGRWLVLGGYDDQIALTRDYAVISLTVVAPA